MAFTAPPEQITFDGLLFDMDGTIIDSTDAVVKHWHTYGRIHSFLLFRGVAHTPLLVSVQK